MVVWVQDTSAVIVKVKLSVGHAVSNTQVFYTFLLMRRETFWTKETWTQSQQEEVLWSLFNPVVLLELVKIIVHCL